MIYHNWSIVEYKKYALIMVGHCNPKQYSIVGTSDSKTDLKSWKKQCVEFYKQIHMKGITFKIRPMKEIIK
jgi:hypothetical protein